MFRYRNNPMILLYIRRKLRGINIQALARMGNQHLRCHPDTFPMEDVGGRNSPPC